MRQYAATAAGGLAGADSVAWKINCEVVLLLGWGRAILLQFAHPLVAAGVAEHSLFIRDRAARVRRLRQTLQAMLALTFGTLEEVHQAAAGINAIHDHVQGVLGTAAGPFPAGTRYSAHDPELLRWVHATLMDTFPATYRRFVGPLSDAEIERYLSEATGMGPLLGVPAGHFPASRAALGSYLEQMYSGGQIVVTPAARRLARELLYPPLPPVVGPLLWPLFWLARLAAVGPLPPAVRAAYGVRWTRGHQAALRLLGGALRLVTPLLPPLLRYWPAARRAFSRQP